VLLVIILEQELSAALLVPPAAIPLLLDLGLVQVALLERIPVLALLPAVLRVLQEDILD
jgi:hypothetical protein